MKKREKRRREKSNWEKEKKKKKFIQTYFLAGMNINLLLIIWFRAGIPIKQCICSFLCKEWGNHILVLHFTGCSQFILLRTELKFCSFCKSRDSLR